VFYFNEICTNRAIFQRTVYTIRSASKRVTIILLY